VITAHLPAGYALWRVVGGRSYARLVAALAGSALPDTDLLFFYFVDGGAIHHHRYWVHVPAFWLVVAAAALPISARAGLLDLAVVFLGAVFLHLALDSVTGGIMWLYPADDTLYEMVTVPATQAHWLLSFVLHWTFLLEFAIWGLAAVLWWRSRQVQGRPTHRN